MSDPFLGQISLFAFKSAPSGWHLCDGATLTISANQALYSVLGKTYGGDGVQTFALPDLRGRVIAGANPGKQIAVGGNGGAEAVALAMSNMPLHTHSFVVSNVQGTATGIAGGVYAVVQNPVPQMMYAPAPAGATGKWVPLEASSIQSTGGGQAHSNLQPYLTLNFCIAMTGLYPPRS